MTNTDYDKAILNYIEIPAIKYELGGDYYFKCPVQECGAELKSYHNFCWKCGQRITTYKEK